MGQLYISISTQFPQHESYNISTTPDPKYLDDFKTHDISRTQVAQQLDNIRPTTCLIPTWLGDANRERVFVAHHLAE